MPLCLQGLQGSGPGGRVIAQDVSVATPAVAAAPTPVAAPGELKCQKIYNYAKEVASFYM